MLLYFGSRPTKALNACAKTLPYVGETETRRIQVYAIIENGSRQYKVQEGDVVFLDKMDIAEGEEVELDKVVAVSNEGKMDVGAPYINGAKVTAKVLNHGKDKKIVIFKYKAKKGSSRRKQGHRQPYTKVQIEKIIV